MSNCPVYFRFFIDDYTRDTEELPLLLHGVYLRLMIWYYGRARPIPNDLQRVYARLSAHTDNEQDAVRFILGEFFVLQDGFWWHGRIQQEIAHWKDRTEKATDNAALRWSEKKVPIKQRQSICKGNANQNQNYKETTTPAPPDLAVSQELWNQFKDFRRVMRAPMTFHAENLLCKKLRTLQIAGNDPVKVVEQSIERGWRGLFPIDKGKALVSVPVAAAHASAKLPPIEPHTDMPDDVRAKLAAFTKRVAA